MSARTIVLTAARLCDSATVQSYCSATQSKVRLTMRPDGRALFTLVNRHGEEIAPSFSMASGLISYIFRAMDEKFSDIKVAL
jgi:hypothetical protein